MTIQRKYFQPSTSSSPAIFVAPPGIKNFKVKVQKSIPTIQVYGALGTIQMLRPDGSIIAWGNNGRGELGVVNLVAQSSPVLVSGGYTFQQIFPAGTGAYHPVTYAIDKNYLIYAWGGASYTSSGVGFAGAYTSSPTLVAFPSTAKIKRLWNFGADELSNNGQQSYAQDCSGTIYTWGGSGVGTSNIGLVSTPTVIMGSYKFTQIFHDMENNFGIGLLADGTAYGWGYNAGGAIGTGAGPLNISSPQLVIGAAKYKTVFIGYCSQPAGVYPARNMGAAWQYYNNAASVFWLDTSNQLWASGYQSAGELGINSNPSIINYVSSPTLVVGGHTYQGVYCEPKSSHNYFLGTDGTLYGCGLNGWGLGQGNNTVAYSSPVVIASGVKFSTAIYPMYTGAATDGDVLAFDTSGNLWGWGPNSYGIMLKGGVQSTPTIIVAANTYNQIMISQLGGYILALDSTGNIYSWGLGAYGGLGLGNNSLKVSTPTIVVGPANNWAKIVNSDINTSFAIDTNGALWGWGLNNNGQLADGTSVNKSSPVLIVGSLPAYMPPVSEVSQSLQLTPNASYPVVVGAQGCYIGGNQIGPGLFPGYGQLILEWRT